MKDLFAEKNIKPMLIGVEGEAFDSPDYIYELKVDGERCVAYLDPQAGTDLRNKRNIKMLPMVPELGTLHEYVERRYIRRPARRWPAPRRLPAFSGLSG